MTGSKAWTWVQMIISPNRSNRENWLLEFTASSGVTDQGEAHYWQDVFAVNAIRREISMDGQILSLTNMEFELLELLLASPSTLFSRDDILKHLRGIEAKIFSRSIDILISRLRHKIEANPKEPKFIKTIWGKGYMFLPRNKPTLEA